MAHSSEHCDPGPDPEVVRRAVRGDSEATRLLLESVRPVVVRYCRARVGRTERTFGSADDVAQDICLAVLTSLPTFRDQGRPFLAFVFGIAAHKVADAHRTSAKNRTEPMSDLPDVQETAAGPEERAVLDDLSTRMGGLLRTLPERQREILVLRVVLGLSADEAAEAIGSTAGAIRVAQHRALTQLRKVVGDSEH
ncbi:sigma-70 family RNA polymerase sigma factor [Umezawaea sp.]|uniref:sigma-70 family RNA polymerase sigma factor n=1 Tax=Umezawaea sp. TaxID=1955258 RepID=UPI002ED18FCD